MIAVLQDQFPPLSLRQLCRLLGVSRSWYYAHPTPEALAARDLDLRDAIERVTVDFAGYGYRRVTHALAREGWIVNHKRVLRIMRQDSLLCHLKRRFLTTTDSAHGLPTYPNLLAQTPVNAPNQAWVADITYVRLPTSFVYLACVLDAYSRRCVGWKLSRQIDTPLALDALEMALAQRRPASGLIHHSDRGVQYASLDASLAYVARLEQAGARVSMSAKGNPYDNAKAESFFKTLKREEVYLQEVYLQEYRTFAEAEANLGHFIEAVYNQKRLHSSLGYLPPVEFETACSLSTDELTCPVVR